MADDINKFDHIEGVPEGCGTGIHDYETDPSLPNGPDLQIGDNNSTVMIMSCKRCKGRHAISVANGAESGLNLNDVIKRSQSAPNNISNEKPIYREKYNQPITNTVKDEEVDDIIIKKLFG